MTGIVDIVVNPYTPAIVAARPAWSRSFLGEKIGMGDQLAGVSIEDYLATMDGAGIQRSLLIAAKMGPVWDDMSFHLSAESVADIVRDHPTRFSGVVGVDPTAGVKELGYLRQAVEQYDFVGAHSYPHWFGLPPDDRRYYPLYATCAELGVPIQLQVGHCLNYNTSRPLRSVGRPITLDTVACDFPELTLVGIHVGWPWTEEMIAVAYKHPNVYIGIDAYSPRHLPEALVHYLNTFGRGKVMFGTDFPVIDPGRAVAEIADLGLRPESEEALLSTTARQVYRLAD